MIERNAAIPICIAIIGIVVMQYFPTNFPSVSATSMTDESPILYDNRGKVLDRLLVGQQVTFSKTLSNEKDIPQPFLFIFEIRDDRGFTHHFAWQNSTLPAKSQVDVSASWIAENPGKYKIRTLLQTQFGGLPPDVGISIYEHELIVIDKASQISEQPQFVNISINGLKPLYEINQTLQFSVTVEGYGVDCLDFQAKLFKIDVDSNSTQPLRSWGRIAECLDATHLRNFTHSFSIGSGAFAPAIILNETGIYKVAIEYRDFITEEYFSVTQDIVTCQEHSLCTYQLKVGNITHPINFRMDGTVENMVASLETESLTAELKTERATSLQIAIPREVVDARAGQDRNSGADEEFVVFIDEVPADATEYSTEETRWAEALGITEDPENYRILVIPIPEGSEKVEIVGTWLI
nr:hypothetical protein Josef01_05d18_32 [uncultured archaeon]